MQKAYVGLIQGSVYDESVTPVARERFRAHDHISRDGVDSSVVNTAADNPERVDTDAAADRVTAPPNQATERAWGWRSNSASWILSLLLHAAAYAVAAAIFAWLGLNLVAERIAFEPTLIRASLDDQTVEDELPAMQVLTADGPEDSERVQSVQQLARQLAIAERGQLDTVVSDAKIALSGNDPDPAGGGEKSPFFRIPESGLAVTRGSFTAWTDPARPRPGQNYQIIIEIRLPDKISRYRIRDLSGVVTGTDGYKQLLPFDRRVPLAARITGGAHFETVRRNMTVRVTGKKLQLAILVPGAERLVKDRIRIRSKRLDEEQELVLVFGQTAPLPGLSDNADSRQPAE